MTIEVGGNAGSAGLRMPMISMTAANINLKFSTVGTATSDTVNFYDAVEIAFEGAGFDTATLEQAVDSTEQTIVDTGTGTEGVLTQILTPSINGTTVVTVRVYIDGSVTEFIASEAFPSGRKICIGDFRPWLAVGNNAVNLGIGSSANVGYDSINSQRVMMLTPIDSALTGLLVGMPFSNSLKVTIQSTNGWAAGSTTHKACVAWLTNLPKGIL